MSSFIERPLGPREAGRLERASGFPELTFKDANATQQIELISSRRAPIVIGRKGSGKTTLVLILNSKPDLSVNVDITDAFSTITKMVEDERFERHTDRASNVWSHFIRNTIVRSAFQEVSAQAEAPSSIISYIKQYLDNLQSDFDARAQTDTSKWLSAFKNSKLPLPAIPNLPEKYIEIEAVWEFFRSICDDADMKVRACVDTVAGYKILHSEPSQTTLG